MDERALVWAMLWHTRMCAHEKATHQHRCRRARQRCVCVFSMFICSTRCQQRGMVRAAQRWACQHRRQSCAYAGRSNVLHPIFSLSYFAWSVHSDCVIAFSDRSSLSTLAHLLHTHSHTHMPPGQMQSLTLVQCRQQDLESDAQRVSGPFGAFGQNHCKSHARILWHSPLLSFLSGLAPALG